MVSTFLGYGLAEAGKAIADTAGTAALQQQKADLENQKITLANQLAEGTETRLAGVQAGYASQLETQKQTGAVELAKTESGLSVGAQQQIAKNAASLQETLGSDPKYLAAQKALNSTDPVKIAQASEMQQQAALLGMQTAMASKIAQARQAIIDEQSKPNPDQNKLNSLQQNFNTLLIDPNARATLVTAMVGNERVNEDAASRTQVELNQATAALKNHDPSDPDFNSLTANVNQLTTRLNSLNKAADDARALTKLYLGGRTGVTSPTAAPEEPKPPASALPGWKYQPNPTGGFWWQDATGKVVGTFDQNGMPIGGASPGGPAPGPRPGLINAPAQ